MSFLNTTLNQLRTENTSNDLISLVQQTLYPLIINNLPLPQVEREDVPEETKPSRIPGLELVSHLGEDYDSVPQVVMKWEQEGITLLLATTLNDFSVICIDTREKEILHGREEDIHTIVNDISMKLGKRSIPSVVVTTE